MPSFTAECWLRQRDGMPAERGTPGAQGNAHGLPACRSEPAARVAPDLAKWWFAACLGEALHSQSILCLHAPPERCAVLG